MAPTHSAQGRHIARIHAQREALLQQRDRLRLEFGSLLVERREMIESLKRRCDDSHASRRRARWPR